MFVFQLWSAVNPLIHKEDEPFFKLHLQIKKLPAKVKIDPKRPFLFSPPTNQSQVCIFYHQRQDVQLRVRLMMKLFLFT